MRENRNPNPSIPGEIIDDILLRLPVKSLLRFRCVSKPWLSLISSSQFVKSHLENTQFTRHKLIIKLPHPDYLYTCSVNSFFDEHVLEAVEITDPMIKKRHRVGCFAGSCYGLVFSFGKSNMFLWNPSTRKSRRIPTDMNYMEWDSYTYGIGYDVSKEDFKVVEIFWDDEHDHKNEVKIYSSKSDGWRRIEDFPFDEPVENYGKFVNGALHWEANTDRISQSPKSWIIVSLDMKMETYGVVPQPDYGEGVYDLTLGKLNECLSVLCNYQNSRADIWIMKEYGVKESWTKVVTLPCIEGISSYKFVTPLHISVNGDVLLQFENSIRIYNSKDKKFRNLMDTNYYYIGEDGMYIESLVSPIPQSSA